MDEIQIRFEPEGKVVKIKKGQNLLEALSKGGIWIDAPCGGKGICGKCKVRVTADQHLPPTGTELKFLTPKEIEEGIRLACQFYPQKEVTVEVLGASFESKEKAYLEEMFQKIKGKSTIKKRFLSLPPPSLDDQRSDEVRLLSALPGAKRIAYSAKQSLPSVLRFSSYQITAVLAGDEVISVEEGNTEEECYGVAFDVGTTTLAVYLVHLPTGTKIASHSAINPQTVFGADVVSRINFTIEKEKGLETMREKVVEGLNNLLRDICLLMGICQERIYQAVIVGNTCMTHFFLGVDASNLAFSPYVPAFVKTTKERARNLGLNISPDAWVFVLPNIAGFVGADTIGVILATSLHRKKGLYLALDIGTNGEIVLGSKEGILVCSTAAGPAFEGAHIQFGMHATAGAIDRVYIDDDVRIRTIEGQPPRGICGSGLLDGVAEMYKAGIVDASGRIRSREELKSLSSSLRDRIIEKNGERYFVLTRKNESATGEDIYITQRDIRELQLAKAAIRAGIEILLDRRGIEAGDLDGVFLAGAFGNYIRRESALRIGLLPSLPLDKIRLVGNAAGRGAMMSLLSPRLLKEAEKIASSAQYIELSALPEFANYFMEAMSFP